MLVGGAVALAVSGLWRLFVKPDPKPFDPDWVSLQNPDDCSVADDQIHSRHDTHDSDHGH